MRIGILGSGNMGAALGRSLAAKGHTVGFSFSRDPRKLVRLARSSGPDAFTDSPREVARRSRVIVLAVHWQQVARVLRLAGDLRGKIIVDCTNPMNVGTLPLSWVTGRPAPKSSPVVRAVPAWSKRSTQCRRSCSTRARMSCPSAQRFATVEMTAARSVPWRH